MLVVLLMWQLGPVSTWQGSAFAAIAGGVTYHSSANCAEHPMHSMPRGSETHPGGQHPAPGENKPECCGSDGSTCCGVAAALPPGDPFLLTVAADHPAPANAPDTARRSYHSSNPFRPPI